MIHIRTPRLFFKIVFLKSANEKRIEKQIITGTNYLDEKVRLKSQAVYWYFLISFSL